MSYTDVEVYADPILALARDPNLNKEPEKTSQLIGIIHGFPLTERKILKLCLLALTILQTLEKIELNLRNWTFLSLDFNSANHFNRESPDDIKSFNNNISLKVLTNCKEFNVKLNRISFDLDYITRALKTLSPVEYMSDSGTLLTSLTLRNIKLKDDLNDKITVAYLKAKLITIGTDLETMLEDDDGEFAATVSSYKQFVVSLLKQLNTAIDAEDLPGKFECLAVISDMEQMFETFKLERAQQMAVYQEPRREDQNTLSDEHKSLDGNQTHPEEYKKQTEAAKLSEVHKTLPEPKKHSDLHKNTSELKKPSAIHTPSSSQVVSDDEYDDNDSEYGSGSMFLSGSYNPPMIHSITRSQQLQAPAPSQMETPALLSGSFRSPAKFSHRRDSVSSMETSTILQKTTISDELPYLMTAFNLARNFEEDIHHYKEENEKERPKRTSTASPIPVPSRLQMNALTSSLRQPAGQEKSAPKHFPTHKGHLPDTSLYSESSVLHNKLLSTPSSYLYANNSLLYKLGIKPQIITAEVPKELANNTTANIRPLGTKTPLLGGIRGPRTTRFIEQTADKDDKENRDITPLTTENLANHTFSGLAVDESSNDYVE